MLNREALACAVGMFIVSGNTVAGGIDLSGMSVVRLFDPGTFIEATYTDISLDMTGEDVGGFETGDVKDDFSDLSLVFKHDINEKYSLAVLKDTPFYAQTTHKTGVFAGLANKVETEGITGLLRYKFDKNVAVHGGVSAHKMDALTVVPAAYIPPDGYRLESEGEASYGYVIGVTYEVPDFHALVGLTYFSEVDNTLKANENGVDTGDLELTTPESVNLDFRVPVSPGNIIFGGIRWTGWDGYKVTAPSGFEVASVTEDTVTYQLGAAHVFSPEFIVFARGSYEAGPKADQDPDNFYGAIKQVGVGFAFTKSKTTVTGLINRVTTDAKTGAIGEFDDGTALALSLSLKQNF
ncbi:hypothetical protein [Granulosicoccus antarcticus]|uniref:Outer membrane protein transport protein (OMPP1/FadL/TodX) n=1 Tax=Granulosicoccus antarcticus IMCC3135 TaxID=1192854 RepID=A0A2Z2NVV3_9GAMM|nr:hypothetical protein [Granulosicoccus antarcticus]ASJ72920.1 hypothetical protein IMCC3135_14175 [Granulosicoccus antarcticus IMCC3135]